MSFALQTPQQHTMITSMLTPLGGSVLNITWVEEMTAINCDLTSALSNLLVGLVNLFHFSRSGEQKSRIITVCHVQACFCDVQKNFRGNFYKTA